MLSVDGSFGRGFDSRRLHHFHLIDLSQPPNLRVRSLFHTAESQVIRAG